LEKSVRELAGIPSSAALKSKDRKAGNRGRRRARSPSLLNLLTERQIQVMRLIASGMSVKDTADSLGLAPSTVDNHKSRLMKRLDIHKSSELTRLAIREGLIDL
jgi:DNA-binding NarL/FixJ family response regulator